MKPEQSSDIETITMEALFKQYDTARQESLNSINNRVQVFSFGLATIGAVYAGTVVFNSQTQSPIFATYVFSYAIPLISILVLYIWVGEIQRMRRAGKFMVELEAEINNRLEKAGGSPVMIFESRFLPANKPLVDFSSLVVIIFFIIIIFGSPVLGISFSQSSSWSINETRIGVPWSVGGLVFIHVVWLVANRLIMRVANAFAYPFRWVMSKVKRSNQSIESGKK